VPHRQYTNTISALVDYQWVQLDSASYKLKSAESTKPETDNPGDALVKFVKGVEAKLGEDAKGEFAKVRTLLLEAIGAPISIPRFCFLSGNKRNKRRKVMKAITF